MSSNGQPMKVWEFDQAPAELQAYSTVDGDANWLILIPRGMFPGIVPSMTSFFLRAPVFGLIQEYSTKDGDTVVIGYSR